MGQINVNTTTVRNVAKSLNDEMTDLYSLARKLESIEGEIKAAWQGAYVGDYIECLERTRKKIMEMGDTVYATKETLKDVANSVDEAERKLQQTMLDSGGFGGNGRGGGGGHMGYR